MNHGFQCIIFNGSSFCDDEQMYFIVVRLKDMTEKHSFPEKHQLLIFNFILKLLTQV